MLPMGACLVPERLVALAAGVGGEAELLHARTCARCARRLERTRAEERLFRELRSELHDVPADEVPGYDVQDEIGHGTQGVVLRALQRSTKRVVALKVLRGANVSPHALWRFEREALLASRLRHPGIVTVYDCGVLRDGAWLAMDLVEGVPLDAWVERERPERARCLALFLELCDAVAHAHRASVVHRDLKPSNVLVDAQGRPRVLDFGVAAAVGEHLARAHEGGSFVGTPAWAAPEQARGDSLDTRTDVYALGLLLWTLLTGALPRSRRGAAAEVLSRVAVGDDPTAELADTRLPADLRAILAAALAPDVVDRYRSVDALARDVCRHLAREPVEVRPRRPLYVAGRACARHRKALVVASLAVIASVLGFGYLQREHERAALGEHAAMRLRDALYEMVGSDDYVVATVALPGARASMPGTQDVLGDVPQAEPVLYQALGERALERGRLDEAEIHLRKAVRAARELGDERVALPQALEGLSRVLVERGSPEAVAGLEEALALRQAALPPLHPGVALTELALARALALVHEEGSLARAEAHARSALATCEQLFGFDDSCASRARVWLASVRARRGATAEGEALLRNALDELRACGEPVVDAELELASLLARTGNVAGAERAGARAAAEIGRSAGALGEREMLVQYAWREAARGESMNAEPLVRRALAVDLREGRRGRPANALELAVAERLAGSVVGEPDYGEALDLLLRRDGELALHHVHVAEILARSLCAMGREAAALAVVEQGLRFRCDGDGPGGREREALERRLVELSAGER